MQLFIIKYWYGLICIYIIIFQNYYFVVQIAQAFL